MDWWRKFFTKDYLDQYETHYLTPERTRREVQAVTKILCPDKDTRILDLACGQGRIAIGLAKKGCRVTGVDYSGFLLGTARNRAGKLKINFIRKDMRKIDFNNEFDCVINWFTAFGYFSDKDNEKLLKKINNALKTGGKFLLDVSHDSPRFGAISPQGWYDHGTYIVLETRRHDEKHKRMNVRREFIFLKSGERKTYDFRIRMYPYPELQKLLKKAGFKILKVYGGYDLSRFTKNSRRMIILAEKQFKD